MSFEELFLRLDAQQDYMRDQARHVARVMWGGENGQERRSSSADLDALDQWTKSDDNDWYPRNN